MLIEHLPADSSPEKAFEILERDGCVVLDGLLERAAIDQIKRDLAPHLEASA